MKEQLDTGENVVTEKFCPNYSGILARTDDAGNMTIVRARCKMWTCPYCAEQNRIRWRYRIADEVNADKERQWSFITITAKGGEDRTPEGTLNELRTGWELFIRKARRHVKPRKLAYLRVYEKHKDGAYHIHALIDLRFDDVVIHIDEETGKRNYESPTMKTWCTKSGMGWKTDARPLKRSGLWGIANYVAKYLTKENDGDYPRNLRRFQTSQGFAPFRQKSSGDWQMLGSGLSYRDARHVWEQGGEIFDIQLNLQVESAHFTSYTDANFTEDDTIYRPIDT